MTNEYLNTEMNINNSNNNPMRRKDIIYDLTKAYVISGERDCVTSAIRTLTELEDKEVLKPLHIAQEDSYIDDFFNQ
jgi:hypothetical protein